MPSRRFAPGGNSPPSCKYLCTASRPVNTTPEIRTSSPTFSARIFSSVKGKEIEIMILIQPPLNFSIRIQCHTLPPIRPAHITDAHEKRRWQAIHRADFHTEQSRLAAEAHRPDAQFVGGFQNVLFQRVQFLRRIAVGNQSQKLS